VSADPVQADIFSQPAVAGVEPHDLIDWAVQYIRQYALPRCVRDDRRELSELSQEELFALPTFNVDETLKTMVAEAEFLGRETL
jgi:hypothetical protein